MPTLSPVDGSVRSVIVCSSSVRASSVIVTRRPTSSPSSARRQRHLRLVEQLVYVLSVDRAADLRRRLDVVDAVVVGFVGELPTRPGDQIVQPFDDVVELAVVAQLVRVQRPGRRPPETLGDGAPDADVGGTVVDAVLAERAREVPTSIEVLDELTEVQAQKCAGLGLPIVRD